VKSFGIDGQPTGFFFSLVAIGCVAVAVALAISTLAGSIVDVWLIRAALEGDARAAGRPQALPAVVLLLEMAGIRLACMVPIGIAIAAVAQPLYDAVYGELTLPTNLTDPFLYRVATQAAVPLIAVTIAWLACETVAAVAVRRLVVAGSGFWASLGGALLQLVCRPFTSIATVATTTLVSIAAIGLVMLGTGLAFDLCLQAARLPNPVALTFSLGPIAGSRDLRPLVFLAAALVLGAAWTAGLAIAGIASAWRSAAWTGETAAASGRVMTPVLSAESTRAASPGSIPPRHTADL
jgi:hypothetical protein